MVVVRENNEIVIRIPDIGNEIPLSELQRIIEYVSYCRIIRKSKAKQEQIDSLARDVNSNWWRENKARLLGE